MCSILGLWETKGCTLHNLSILVKDHFSDSLSELDETYTIRNHTAALGRSATRLPTPQPLFHVDKGQHHSLVLGLVACYPKPDPCVMRVLTAL
jgi:hypothetical protein